MGFAEKPTLTLQNENFRNTLHLLGLGPSMWRIASSILIGPQSEASHGYLLSFVRSCNVLPRNSLAEDIVLESLQILFETHYLG